MNLPLHLTETTVDGLGDTRQLTADGTPGPVVAYGRNALRQLFEATRGEVGYDGVPQKYNRELLKALKEGVVVSRPNQKIYEWRGMK